MKIQAIFQVLQYSFLIILRRESKSLIIIIIIATLWCGVQNSANAKSSACRKRQLMGVNTHKCDDMNSNGNLDNGVNEAGSLGEGLTLGRCPVAQQYRPGRHQATAEMQLKRTVWTKDDNRLLFECYVRSEPEKRGYRKRLLTIWNTQNTNHRLKDVSEERLADQVRQIKVKKWLENVEQQEIYLRVRGEQQLNNTETIALAESIQEDRNSDNMQVEEESPDQTIPSVRQQEGGNTDTVIPNSPQQLVTGDDNNEATTDLKERILPVITG